MNHDYFKTNLTEVTEKSATPTASFGGDEMKAAKARQLVLLLAGETTSSALSVLDAAQEMIVEEALSAVLSAEYRTEAEKQIAPFVDPLLKALVSGQVK